MMMKIAIGTAVRLHATGFDGRVGLVDYIEPKAEAFRGWNYSVLVFEGEAMASQNSEYYCFSRDELELLGEAPASDEIACDPEKLPSENVPPRYVAYALDLSAYAVYDSVAEKDVCVCAEYENSDLPEMRAKLIVDALNRGVADRECKL